MVHAAEVTIDGVRLGAVGLRKKGTSSRTDLRPAPRSTSIASAGRPPPRPSRGWRSTTTERPHARACVSYQVFRVAGVPAPRCTLAHVTVNGDDQGYGLVEEIDAHFLARQFAQPGGQPVRGHRQRLPARRHRRVRSRDQPRRPVAGRPRRRAGGAGRGPTPRVEAALVAVIDPDQFLPVLATEIVVWHREG
ncbi:MAG: CotH kinase family protein [Myxococcales bacterium]|nr:CotH kinase family protein [Myxococcales bacterium]